MYVYTNICLCSKKSKQVILVFSVIRTGESIEENNSVVYLLILNVTLGSNSTNATWPRGWHFSRRVNELYELAETRVYVHVYAC